MVFDVIGFQTVPLFLVLLQVWEILAQEIIAAHRGLVRHLVMLVSMPALRRWFIVVVVMLVEFRLVLQFMIQIGPCEVATLIIRTSLSAEPSSVLVFFNMIIFFIPLPHFVHSVLAELLFHVDRRTVNKSARGILLVVKHLILGH